MLSAVAHFIIEFSVWVSPTEDKHLTRLWMKSQCLCVLREILITFSRNSIFLLFDIKRAGYDYLPPVSPARGRPWAHLYSPAALSLKREKALVRFSSPTAIPSTWWATRSLQSPTQRSTTYMRSRCPEKNGPETNIFFLVTSGNLWKGRKVDVVYSARSCPCWLSEEIPDGRCEVWGVRYVVILILWEIDSTNISPGLMSFNSTLKNLIHVVLVDNWE